MDSISLVIDKINDLKENQNSRLDRIDANLAEHMRRTEILETRVDHLEEPRKALKYLKNTLIGVASILGVVLTILRISQHLNIK